MESIDLDMGDLFDNEAVGENEDIGAHAPLPDFNEEEGPMRLEGEGETQEDEEGVVANLQRLAKGAAKKRVMKPQPKLDADRIKGERGLAILPKIFENVKFKGKGYEAEDLKIMMGKLEHWAHRLFPKLPFHEFTERMETLGAKKAAQTCLGRIRLDMPVLDDDYVQQYDDNTDQADQEGETMDTSVPRDYGDDHDDLDAEEAFEEMIRQEKRRKQQESGISMNNENEEGSSQPSGSLKTVTPRKISQISDKKGDTEKSKKTNTPGKENKTPTKSQSSQNGSQGMTPDIKAKIEENKRKALERRAARLGVPLSTLMSPKPSTPASTNTQTQNSPAVQSQDHTVANNETPENKEPELQSQTSSRNCFDNSESQVVLENVQNSVNDPSQNEGNRPQPNEEMQTEDEILNSLESDNDDCKTENQSASQNSNKSLNVQNHNDLNNTGSVQGIHVDQNSNNNSLKSTHEETCNLETMDISNDGEFDSELSTNVNSSQKKEFTKGGVEINTDKNIDEVLSNGTLNEMDVDSESMPIL